MKPLLPKQTTIVVEVVIEGLFTKCILRSAANGAIITILDSVTAVSECISDLIKPDENEANN